jgi:asparaginyl-tRNA synthetase
MNEHDAISQFQQQIHDPRLLAAIRINSTVLLILQQIAVAEGFTQLMPLLLSPITDPLNHAVYPAELQYEDRRLRLTASMIFHKQLSLALLAVPKIFIVSPNIRLEKASVKNSSNHLIEFSQFDLEWHGASMSDVMSFLDRTIRHVISHVRCECAQELQTLGRKLPAFEQPFPIFSSDELRAKWGDDFEARLSKESTLPSFVTNFRREFYDRETPGRRGCYNNFDLIYPEGFGEALSGAEREFEYEQIIYRMQELGMDLRPFENYLEAAKRKLLPSTAGAGLGIQRLVKYLCGRTEIRDVCLFDRSVASSFTF